MTSPTPTSKPGKKTLTAVVGATAAAMLLGTATQPGVIQTFEGWKLRGYVDPVGIATKCGGDTTDVVVGKLYTEAECRESLNTQLVKHAEPIMKCVPQLQGNVYMTVAAVSFGYNIGVRAFCNSGAAQAFRAGNYALGCKRINQSDTGKPQWITAQGIVLPGLVDRRAKERRLCEKGLNP